MESLKQITIKKLKERNVQLKDLAPIVLKLQQPFNPNITIKECEQCIESVLEKREVQHAILTGIDIDETVEKKKKKNSIHKIIQEDNSLYGIDEILALSIVNIYGSIALTTFGYLDKVKPGIIKQIDKPKNKNTCNTFLDDIVCAIIAAAASKIAHTIK